MSRSAPGCEAGAGFRTLAAWCSRAFDAKGAEWLALPGLYLFAIAYVGSKAVANVGLAMVVAAFLFVAARRRVFLLRDPMIRLGVAWVAYLSLLSVWRSMPGTKGTLLEAENLCLAFVPAVAWITRGNPVRIGTALGLALLGMLLTLSADVDLATRFGFDYTQTADLLGVNRNISSLILNTAIVGVILFGIACVRGLRKAEGSRAPGVAALLTTSAIFLILVAPWAASPSRTLWLSLILVAAIVVARALPLRVAGALMVATIFFAGFLLIVLQSQWFVDVLMRDGDSWRALFAGEWSSLPDTSTGLRMQMLAMGFERLAENPLFGVVNGGSQILREHPEFVLSYAAQLHNGYLEILVRTGLVGLLFFVVAIGLASREAIRARRASRLSATLGELLLAALLMLLLVNLTNAVIFFQHGWQFLVFFAGVAYGHARTWTSISS